MEQEIQKESNIKDLSESKYKILLILTLIFGFIFRLININTRELLGDPPHFAIQAINFLNSGLLVIWDQSGYLWYALTNIFYNIFGITQFATRFSSLLFGTLSILAIYLLILEFSGKKKLALISAMIYAFAPGIIWQVADEHDISALFFIIMAFYALIYGLNHKSKNYMLLSSLIFGVAAMWKAYVAILLIPYVGMIVYYHYTKRFDIKKNWKRIFWMLIIIGLLVSPTLVYNYSNYKHNGVVDFIFANFLNIKNDKITSLYGWTSAQEISESKGFINSVTKMFITAGEGKPPVIVPAIKSLFSTGHLLVIMILIGSVFMFLRRRDGFAKDYLVFFGLYFIIPFLVISSGNYLSKHLVQFTVFAIPLTAYFVVEIYDKLKIKFNWNNKKIFNKKLSYLYYALIILFVFFVLLSRVTPQYGPFLSPNPAGKFIEYKSVNIPQDALIVYDDRIYNSEAGWLFNDRNYISVGLLGEFNKYNSDSPYKNNVPVYIIECGVDDCGWGTVGSNPTLNDSMEAFFNSVKNQSITNVHNIKTKVFGLSYYNPLITKNTTDYTSDYIKIYKTQMEVDLNVAKQIKMQYNYFLYPTGYLNKEDTIFKNFIYTPEGFFEESINKIAWLIFYINIILSFLIIIFVLFETYLHI
jgi:4-amino-4-deoxy-L-arabinose transferase-like glycosyltransferase